MECRFVDRIPLLKWSRIKLALRDNLIESTARIGVNIKQVHLAQPILMIHIYPINIMDMHSVLCLIHTCSLTKSSLPTCFQVKCKLKASLLHHPSSKVGGRNKTLTRTLTNNHHRLVCLCSFLSSAARDSAKTRRHVKTTNPALTTLIFPFAPKRALRWGQSACRHPAISTARCGGGDDPFFVAAAGGSFPPHLPSFFSSFFRSEKRGFATPLSF